MYAMYASGVAHKTLHPPGPMQENALSIDPAFGMLGQHAQLLNRRHPAEGTT